MLQVFQILAKTMTIVGYSLFSTYRSMYSFTVATVVIVYFVTILLQTDVMSMLYNHVPGSSGSCSWF